MRARRAVAGSTCVVCAALLFVSLTFDVTPGEHGGHHTVIRPTTTTSPPQVRAQTTDANDESGTVNAWAMEQRELPPQCQPLGPKFAAAVKAWLRPRPNDRRPRFIYNCQANRKGRLCGGMGDRFRGMISVAYLALILDRPFQLYHPVPVPLETYLEPTEWFDWRLNDTPDDIERIPVNTALMRLSGHGRFMRFITGASKEAQSDLRVQSNSFGVDPYVQRVPTLARRLSRELGLSRSCNLTCYFGCMYGLLFNPSAALRRSIESQFAAHHGPAALRVDWDRGDGGFQLRDVASGSPVPFVGVQIRMGGSWAPFLEVPEPFRTPPAAVAHFFSILRELTVGATSLSGAPRLVRRHTDGVRTIFVTSDSERLVNYTHGNFSQLGVTVFRGGGFSHTDSSHLHNFNRAKWREKTPEERDREYLATLTSHTIIANSDHVVMAQSGFGDTAFWRSRGEASALFVDMNNLRVAWQHHLSYQCDGECTKAECGCPAIATLNRVIDVSTTPRPYYAAAGRDAL